MSAVNTGLADLALAKTASAGPVTAGGSGTSNDVTYTISVNTQGPADAFGVRVTDTIPANTNVSAVTIPGDWNCVGLVVGAAGGTTFTCSPTASPWPNGQAAAIVYTVEVAANVPQGTLLTNQANIGTFGPGATPDPSTGNNTQGPTQTLVNTIADVSIRKDDSVSAVAGGAPVSYKITVTNNGPSDAQNIEVSDSLPAGLLFEGITAPAGWNCTTPAVGQGGTITCTPPVSGDRTSVEMFPFGRLPLNLSAARS
ncbi:MAG: DUF11 domain-containing protein [Acidobacteria bacterium]|nr:DUF11 domain-containing protein [Acidobacteriota bacterium]